ncbi:MAG: sulfotransferase [Candidatus Paceibacterota bacterium]
MDKTKKTVLYIMGDVRSGTTLLENLLAKSPDIISVGELRNFSDHYNKKGRGITWDWKCSCGESIDQCEYWKSILNLLKKKGIDEIENTKIDTEGYNEKNYTASNIIFEIYKAIFANQHIDFIIDSSKVPHQGMYLYYREDDDIDIKFIYMRRDLRAVSFSKQKWDHKFDSKKRSLYRLLLGSKHVELDCKKYLSKVKEDDKIFISYEDLSKKPAETIHKICVKFCMNKFAIPEYMYLDNDHTIGGTPNRFTKRKIEYDNTWKKKMAGKLLFRLTGKLLNSI